MIFHIAPVALALLAVSNIAYSVGSPVTVTAMLAQHAKGLLRTPVPVPLNSSLEGSSGWTPPLAATGSYLAIYQPKTRPAPLSPQVCPLSKLHTSDT